MLSLHNPHADAREPHRLLDLLLIDVCDGLRRTAFAALFTSGNRLGDVLKSWSNALMASLNGIVATRQKVKNVRRDPRVAINVYDPKQPWRVANIRGRVVDVTTAGADEHIDELAKKYLGVDKYPFRRPGQQRTILRIQPERIHSIGLDEGGG